MLSFEIYKQTGFSWNDPTDIRVQEGNVLGYMAGIEDQIKEIEDEIQNTVYNKATSKYRTAQSNTRQTAKMQP